MLRINSVMVILVTGSSHFFSLAEQDWNRYVEFTNLWNDRFGSQHWKPRRFVGPWMIEINHWKQRYLHKLWVYHPSKMRHDSVILVNCKPNVICFLSRALTARIHSFFNHYKLYLKFDDHPVVNVSKLVNHNSWMVF
jgi:hypothetical protein